MKFYFEKRESAGRAIRRINLELRANMIGILGDESLDADTAVHELRKCVKKLRAVLRLTRPAMKKPVFRSCDRALRDFARLISSTRDSAVMVKTYDCLIDHYRPYISNEEMLPVRQALQNRHVLAMAEYRERIDRKEIESAFLRLEMRLDHADNVKLSRPLLETAVRDVYRRGRKLHQALGLDPSSENSHGLRRQAKYLWYQLRMLEKQLPGHVRPVLEDLDELCEMLGDDNDMEVLTETLRANPGICCNSVRAELIYGLAETRRIALLSASLRVSERIYARKPGQFARDLFAQA